MATIDVNEINKRYNLIGQRLSAIEKEQQLLEKERESLHILLELYTNNQRYYDIIKEESTITNTLMPTTPTSSGPTKRKYKQIDIELVLMILETPKTATQIAKEYGDVPSSTIRDTLLRLVEQGKVIRKQNKTYVRKEIDE